MINARRLPRNLHKKNINRKQPAWKTHYGKVSERATNIGQKSVLTELCCQIDHSKKLSNNSKIPYLFVSRLVCEAKSQFP